MGCPDTFELRRRELADLRRRSPQEAGAGEVTDEEVVQSFLGTAAHIDTCAAMT